MAVIYRCDTCNKIVENDKNIVKIKFMFYTMHEGKQDTIPEWSESRLVCTECRNKFLNIGNIENEIFKKWLPEEKDNG